MKKVRLMQIRFMTRFYRHQQGNVLMLTGLAILFMFAAAGAGVDFGRQQLVRLKIQQATDAAALAAVSLANTATNDEKTAIAQRYFELNYPDEYLGISRPGNVSITPGDKFVVTASANVPTQFIANVGIEQLTSAGSTTVQNQTDLRTTGYDSILVMDNSGSMDTPLDGGPYLYTGGYQSTARANGKEQCLISQKEFVEWYCSIPAYVRYSGYGNAQECLANHGTNICRPVTSDQTLSILDGDKSRINVLRNAASTFAKRMGELNADSRVGFVTYGDIAFRSQKLGRDNLQDSPFLRSMASYGDTNSYSAMLKAKQVAVDFDSTHVQSVILLTDGVNNRAGETVTIDSNGYPHDAYGCPGSACQSDALTLGVCKEFRDRGVRVFTIAFGNEATNPKVRNFMINCASKDQDGNPLFYGASQSDQLNAAFDNIFTTIRKVQITN